MLNKIKNDYLEWIDMYKRKPAILGWGILEVLFVLIIGWLIFIGEVVLITQFVSEATIDAMSSFTLITLFLVVYLMPFVILEGLMQLRTARLNKKEEYLSSL